MTGIFLDQRGPIATSNWNVATSSFSLVQKYITQVITKNFVNGDTKTK